MRTYDEHKNFLKKFINLFGQSGVCKEKRTYIPQSNSDCRRPTKLTPPPPPPPPSSSSSSSGENFSMIIPSIKESLVGSPRKAQGSEATYWGSFGG